MKTLPQSIASSLLAAASLVFTTTGVEAHPPKAASFAVGSQYDTTHVYVAPEDVDKFVQSFVATFGGQSTRQVVATVTPTPSSTTSQLVQTPAGTVSVFGFKTPIPFPFGLERNGYLVTDLDKAIQAARAAGADLVVSAFPDPIGRDAVIQWPGGVNLQLYWHTTKPAYAAFETIPENRVYVSPDRVAAFVRSFTAFSHGKVVSDKPSAPGVEIGRAGQTYRRLRIESPFGKMQVLVTDGHLPSPYGHETTGYEVASLTDTLAKAQAAGVKVLIQPFDSEGRTSSVVEFPGGYVAEIHSVAATGAARSSASSTAIGAASPSKNATVAVR
jgi:predicted enzyme related to lactoylglutathione lyase